MPLFKVRLQEAWNWGGLSPWALIVRTWRAIDQHNTFNQAAVVAYYSMLALVPLLSVILVAALGARAGVAESVRRVSAEMLPAEADVIVRGQLDQIQSATPIGLLSISGAILLWSASSLFVSVMDATSTA
jgi:uncharacterized BrkB/YihY/UPF0761 family membrane protein